MVRPGQTLVRPMSDFGQSLARPSPVSTSTSMPVLANAFQQLNEGVLKIFRGTRPSDILSTSSYKNYDLLL